MPRKSHPNGITGSAGDVALQREAELLEIAQLVGTDALPESEKALLHVARLLREDFLQQYAYAGADAYCPPEKQFWMLRAILEVHRFQQAAIQRGVPLARAMSVPRSRNLAVRKVSRRQKQSLE